MHLQTGQFSQSTCWTLAEDLRPQKDEKDSHISGKDERKKKRKRKRRGSRTGPVPLAGSWRWWEGPASGEAPSLMRKSALTGGEIWRLIGLCHSPACLGLRLVSTSEQGLSTGTWGLERRSGEATAIGYQQTTWRDGSKELDNPECSWRKPGLP